MIFISIGQCRTNFNPAIVWRLFKCLFLMIFNEVWQKNFSSVFSSWHDEMFKRLLVLYTSLISQLLCSSFSLNVFEKKLLVTAYYIRPKMFFFIQPKNSLIVRWVSIEFFARLFCISAWTFGSNSFPKFIYYSFRLLFRFRKHFLIGNRIFVTTQFLDLFFFLIRFFIIHWFAWGVFEGMFRCFIFFLLVWICWI